MDKLTKTETVTIRLVNEIFDLAADCEQADSVPGEVKMRLEYLSGYAAALKAIIAEEKGAEA
jgi:hypothetical protein